MRKKLNIILACFCMVMFCLPSCSIVPTKPGTETDKEVSTDLNDETSQDREETTKFKGGLHIDVDKLMSIQ